MKKFILKSFLFLLLPFLLLLVPLMIPGKSISYKLDENIKTIIIGDSHIQCAIQDEKIPSCNNFAISSESTFFSYFRIKKLIENNPNIEKIYLGFSYHNISSYYDKFIFGEYSKVIAPRYFDILPFHQKLNIVKHNKDNLIAFYKSFLDVKQSVFQLGYRNRFKDKEAVAKVASMNKRINFQYFDKSGEQNNLSDINIQYLIKINELTTINKIELIILDIPVHDYYYNLIPEKFKNNYNKLMEENNFNKVDFKNLNLNDACFIPDGDHLSEKGAEVLTLHLLNNSN